MLKWAYNNGCYLGEWTYSSAAEGGHLEVLQWACKNSHRRPGRATCTSAAKAGRLEILKWARENDCPWDKTVCKWAAKAGHLEILKWARANDWTNAHLTPVINTKPHIYKSCHHKGISE